MGDCGPASCESTVAPWRRATRCYLGVAVLYTADKLLSFGAGLAGITFPPALVGLFLLVPSLLLLAHGSPAAADAVTAFFGPGVDWVAHRWLPTFYVPALVMLPLAVQPLSGWVLAKAVAAVCVGVVLVLAFTAQVAVWIRRATCTEMDEAEWHHHPLVFSKWLGIFWACVALGSLLAAANFPSRLGVVMAFPFLLSTTVLGYLGGLRLPPQVQRVVHPLVVCGVAPNAGAALLGVVTGEGYWATLCRYHPKGAGGAYGPGDLLFSFLGVIILSFGFKIFEQRAVMRRHAAEILGATSASATLSMLSTAALCRLLAMPPDISRAMVPRSVTMALALPIASQLAAPQPITAAAVVLTGILGANFLQTLLSALRFRDPIAWGLAAAATAHGLGTAALAAEEPEALPFCALSYALCGILSTCLVSLPFVRAVLEAITG